MKKSVFKHLIADNKRLRKEVYTLIAEPDSLSAMEIRIAHEINHSIIKGIMFGRCKEVVREPLDQTKLDKFVEYWIKSPILPYPNDYMDGFEQRIENYLRSNHLSEKERDFFLELPNFKKQLVLDGDFTLASLMSWHSTVATDLTTVKSGECNIHVKKHPFWKGLF